jgi:hypothetical protein
MTIEWTSNRKSKNKCGDSSLRSAQNDKQKNRQRQNPRQQQIPFGDDNEKGKGKNKYRGSSPFDSAQGQNDNF